MTTATPPQPASGYTDIELATIRTLINTGVNRAAADNIVREDIAPALGAEQTAAAAQHAIAAEQAASAAGRARDQHPDGSPEKTRSNAYAAVARNAANKAQDASTEAAKAHREIPHSNIGADQFARAAGHWANLARHERAVAEAAAQYAANPNAAAPA